jgi:cyclopropane-fatty-acyl-phospholipid synthase
MNQDNLRNFFTKSFGNFPWEIIVTDWKSQSFTAGGKESHWSGSPLQITLHTEAVGKDILSLNAMGVLEHFVRGTLDFEGNLYALSFIKKYIKFERLSLLMAFPSVIKNLAFQSVSRAKLNVKSHYDIPQEALDLYLDRAYQSYSCAIFENPAALRKPDLLRVGTGKDDSFDSLEKAQWRKFKDAVDFINPKEGETLFDVGCGYGGQLAVALDYHPFGKVVGWTHSNNQYNRGKELLSKYDPLRWEIHEGDYRLENRVFDHITSTGMACHVGPRGLLPYVRQIRKRIKTGGRYLHHVIMSTPNIIPFDFQIGPRFNKKYVWPGFHWFTLGTHLKALENNGFQAIQVKNLSPHYEKATAAWYERMMDKRKEMTALVGDQTFRAWRIYLAGISGGFAAKTVTINRIYCEAV